MHIAKRSSTIKLKRNIIMLSRNSSIEVQILFLDQTCKVYSLNLLSASQIHVARWENQRENCYEQCFETSIARFKQGKKRCFIPVNHSDNEPTSCYRINEHDKAKWSLNFTGSGRWSIKNFAPQSLSRSCCISFLSKCRLFLYLSIILGNVESLLVFRQFYDESSSFWVIIKKIRNFSYCCLH